MTTKITSKYEAPNHVTIGRADTWSGVYVGTAAMGERTGTAVDRAEFLAAVSAELGVLIINRDDLPPVTASTNTNPAVFCAGDICYGHDDDPARIRANALAQLAIAEHLAANPPVDEAQVNALTKVIGAETIYLTNPELKALARRLVLAGVRAPEETGR